MDSEVFLLDCIMTVERNALFIYLAVVVSFILVGGVGVILLCISLRRGINASVQLEGVYGSGHAYIAMCFRIENHLNTPVVLSRIEWECEYGHRITQVFGARDGDGLPVKLEKKDTVYQRVSLFGGNNVSVYRLLEILKYNGSDIKIIKCWAVLSTGHKYPVEIDNNIRKVFVFYSTGGRG